MVGWYVERLDPASGGDIVIVREGPFKQEADAVADAESRGMGWRVVSSSEGLETGVVV